MSRWKFEVIKGIFGIPLLFLGWRLTGWSENEMCGFVMLIWSFLIADIKYEYIK